jgi:hypothetical protein
VKQERNKDLPANWTYMDKKTVSPKNKKNICSIIKLYRLDVCYHIQIENIACLLITI